MHAYIQIYMLYMYLLRIHDRRKLMHHLELPRQLPYTIGPSTQDRARCSGVLTPIVHTRRDSQDTWRALSFQAFELAPESCHALCERVRRGAGGGGRKHEIFVGVPW